MGWAARQAALNKEVPHLQSTSDDTDDMHGQACPWHACPGMDQKANFHAGNEPHVAGQGRVFICFWTIALDTRDGAKGSVQKEQPFAPPGHPG